jgi:toxin ParE1/3/4
VARIEVAPEVAGDLDRIVDHLTQHDASRIDERVAGLIDAIEVLTHSPLMGRPVRQDLRELIVGRAAEGYLILYNRTFRKSTPRSCWRTSAASGRLAMLIATTWIPEAAPRLSGCHQRPLPAL